MATSNPHTQGVESGAATLITRPMIDTQTPGQALVTAVFAGPGLLETHTGIDDGTGDVTIYITVEGREKPIELINETVIEEDLPYRRQWSYHDPDESKPKQTRWIPGQLTLHPPGK